MPDQPDKPSPGVGLHEGASGLRPAPPAGPRAMSPTLTDPAELEDARQRSALASSPPVWRTSMLSLVNARAPSIVPPAPGIVSGASSELDEAWDEDEPSPPPATAASAPAAPKPPAEEMAERLSLGDYTGALRLAEDVLAAEPEHAAALETADTCREVLRKMYAARIGPLDRIPNVTVARDQMRWLSIDHRAGFVLSLVDGVSTVEMLLDVSGMPTLDALRILSELVQQRIITFR